MQDVDVPIPEPGAPECTVGLNAAGEQHQPVAPSLEMGPTLQNVAVDTAHDSPLPPVPQPLSAALPVPCEAADTAVGPSAVKAAQQMTSRERQLEGLLKARKKRAKKLHVRKGVSHDAHLKAASAERNLASCKPLRQKQSKAQNIRFVELLCQNAADWEAHREVLGSGPLPEAAPCGDSVQQYMVKHEGQSKLKRIAATIASRKRCIDAKPGVSRKKRIVDGKEVKAGVTNQWAADVTCYCCGQLSKTLPKPVGARAAPTEKARPCSGRCGNGLHASCWQLLGGEALPVECWSCADLDQSMLPWSCHCVTFAAV